VSLADIPIRLEPPARTGGLGGGVTALLSEVADLLERLANGDNPAIIDLRSLPMSGQDRVALQETLGDGEVHVTLDADGISTLYETAIAGVWWVEHRDRHGDVIAELLEIARFPQILDGALDDIATSAVALRALLRAGAAGKGAAASPAAQTDHAIR